MMGHGAIGSMGFGFGGGFAMFLVTILFWGMVVAGTIYLIRALASRGTDTTGADRASALESLRMRYARGEISRQEFERISYVLTQMGSQ